MALKSCSLSSAQLFAGFHTILRRRLQNSPDDSPAVQALPVPVAQGEERWRQAWGKRAVSHAEGRQEPGREFLVYFYCFVLLSTRTWNLFISLFIFFFFCMRFFLSIFVCRFFVTCPFLCICIYMLVLRVLFFFFLVKGDFRVRQSHHVLPCIYGE